MKIGMMVGEGSGAAPELDGLIARGKMIESSGLDTGWIANIALDAMTAATALGSATSSIEIGTAVVPTFTRHPVAMLQQAGSTQLACNGRFTLGIGLAHKFLVEDVWGLSYEKPARQMRAYLDVIAPALRGEAVACENELYRVNMPASPPGTATSILVAALGPQMLKLTGELADGTITWAAGTRTLSEHIVPGITASAEAAGRAAPRVVAGLPVVLTSNVDQARELAARLFGFYAQVPSYRAMLDREGVQGLEDLAIIGDESVLQQSIVRLESAGVTDLCVFPFETEAGEIQRTAEFLGQQ